ncbi:hypothetical protein Q1695_004158 [Nippostrongylus brasiliensis]|nr:hypothetical protein Q1695_004158 [Nippostrongylus brasiliensis]
MAYFLRSTMGDSSYSDEEAEDSHAAKRREKRKIRCTMLTGFLLFCVVMSFAVVVSVYASRNVEQDYPIESVRMLGYEPRSHLLVDLAGDDDRFG